MAVFTVLCDNREQKPYHFDGYPVDTENVTLKTGDYTLAQFCEYDAEHDTYHPTKAVERKAPSDFLGSITGDRDRFKDEIKRASDWDEPMKVVVEAPWSQFQNRYSDVLQYRKVYPNQIEGTVREWEKWYNVEFDFHPSRLMAEQATFDCLMTAYRTGSFESR